MPGTPPRFYPRDRDPEDFEFRIDGARVWDRVLRADEIQPIYAHPYTWTTTTANTDYTYTATTTDTGTTWYNGYAVIERSPVYQMIERALRVQAEIFQSPEDLIDGMAFEDIYKVVIQVPRRFGKTTGIAEATHLFDDPLVIVPNRSMLNAFLANDYRGTVSTPHRFWDAAHGRRLDAILIDEAQLCESRCPGFLANATSLAHSCLATRPATFIYAEIG